MQAAASFQGGVGGWQALAHAACWTLVHSLWIGASLCALLHGLLRFTPGRRARLRYGACLSALFAVPLAAAWTLTAELWGDDGGSWLGAGPEGTAPGAAAWGAWWIDLGALVAAAEDLRALCTEFLEPAEGWIAAGWTVLAALALARLVGGWTWLARGNARDLTRASPRLQARLARLARRLCLARSPGLYWSSRADVPMVVGVLRPRVVLPARMVGEALRGRLDTVLLHELGHVRRRDGLVRALEAVCGALFVFHPFLHWIQSRVAREREHCCDDLALEGGADRVLYLRTLARLEAARAAWKRSTILDACTPSMAAASLFGRDGELLERARRLAGAAPAPGRFTLARAAGALAVGGVGLAFGAVPTHDRLPYGIVYGLAIEGLAEPYEGLDLRFGREIEHVELEGRWVFSMDSETAVHGPQGRDLWTVKGVPASPALLAEAGFLAAEAAQAGPASSAAATAQEFEEGLLLDRHLLLDVSFPEGASAAVQTTVLLRGKPPAGVLGKELGRPLRVRGMRLTRQR